LENEVNTISNEEEPQ